MKAYLIDFENVKSKGLNGIEQLGENDKVIIFYSENSDTISFEMHRKVMQSPADIEYLKVRVGGKNALDFQLSTLLGFMVAKDIYSHIFIISNDKGFDKLHDFWNGSFSENTSCIVFRNPTIAAAVNYANANSIINKAAELNILSDSDGISDNSDNEETAYEMTDEAPELLGTNIQQDETEQASAASEAQSEAVYSQTDENTILPIEILNEEHELAWVANTDEITDSVCTDDIKITKIPAKKRGRRPKSASGQIRSSLLGICDVSDEEIETIKNCMIEAESKEDFHNALAKIFKQQAGELYKILRPKYLRLKELLASENSLPAEETAADTTAENSTADENKESCAAPLYSEVSRILSGKCSDDEINSIVEIIEETDSKQRLYLSIVKKYKKDRGCEIYKNIKPEYASLEKLRSTSGI